VVSQKSADFIQLGNAGPGLAPDHLVQSDPVWHGPVQPIIFEFKTASHIYTPNLRGKKTSSCIQVNMAISIY